MLPAHVIWVLLAELTLLAGFAVGWEVSGSSPAGWAQFSLLATLAAAMGMQSSAVKDMGLTEVSTTYLTGTLTGLVSSLVSPGQDTPHGVRRFGVLIGLAAGASLCGLFVATAAAGVPALPLAALITAIVAATGPGWRSPQLKKTQRALNGRGIFACPIAILSFRGTRQKRLQKPSFRKLRDRSDRGPRIYMHILTSHFAGV